MPKEKKTRTREKKIRKGRKHESVKPHRFYEIRGDTLARNRNFCPRCGPGVWFSQQKGRLYCGKCGYTDFQKGGRLQEITEEPKKEETPEMKPEEKKPQEEGKPPEEKAQEEKTEGKQE